MPVSSRTKLFNILRIYAIYATVSILPRIQVKSVYTDMRWLDRGTSSEEPVSAPVSKGRVLPRFYVAVMCEWWRAVWWFRVRRVVHGAARSRRRLRTSAVSVLFSSLTTVSRTSRWSCPLCRRSSCSTPTATRSPWSTASCRASDVSCSTATDSQRSRAAFCSAAGSRSN